MGMRITGGEVLLPDGLVAAPMTLADGVIGVGGAAGLAEFDARGLWVLPGVIDLHGDAFERQVQPRPGVAFDAGLALADTEAQLLANGITTAFHAVTLSWEPGLRSPAAWRSLLDALGARRWSCDMRVHMRWEMHNLDALDMALADIRAGRVHLVSFNDHNAIDRAEARHTGGGGEVQRACDDGGGCVSGAGSRGLCAGAGGAGGRRPCGGGGRDGRAADGEP